MSENSGTSWEKLHTNARHVAGFLRLPLRRRTWRGVQGNWQGAGTGSSLDFQDHRPYSPGDDPRYINWQAYARSGHYTMKLYRQEVSPSFDLVVDVSASMFLDGLKAARVVEILYWCVECGLQAGASLRCWAWRDDEVVPIAIDSLLAHEPLEQGKSAMPAAIEGVPWRHGSLRVVLSDLLWPGETQGMFHALTGGQGFGLVLAPFSPEESEPSWGGNMEMLDCETSALRIQRVDSDTLRRYRAAYQQHFSLWEDRALRHQVALARIASDCDLATALRPHLAGAGAVEWVG